MTDLHIIPTDYNVETTTASYPSGLAFDEVMFREYGYQIIEEVVSYLGGIRERPVWQPMPDEARAALRGQELPQEGQPFGDSLNFIEQMILPSPQGNSHPRFADWINSAPAHAGILVKPLVAALNNNCGIGNHAGQELERRVVQWIMQLCGFPVEGSAGVFVSGGSEANFTLKAQEGIFAGPSSGAVLDVALRVAASLYHGKIVVILADGGWKYMSESHWMLKDTSQALGVPTEPLLAV